MWSFDGRKLTKRAGHLRSLQGKGSTYCGRLNAALCHAIHAMKFLLICAIESCGQEQMTIQNNIKVVCYPCIQANRMRPTIPVPSEQYKTQDNCIENNQQQR